MDTELNNSLPAVSPVSEVSAPKQEAVQVYQYVEDATRSLREYRPSFISRLFPTVKDRLMNEIQQDVLKVNGKLYVNSVTAMGDCVLQAFKEDLNDRLLRHAATLRTITIKHADEKLAEVSEELSRQQQRLIVQIEKDIDFCKSIKSDFLRKKYEQAIIQHTEEVFDMFAKLSNHFSTFLDARIGSA